METREGVSFRFCMRKCESLRKCRVILQVPGLGMPVYQKPGEFGKLIVKLNIVFPERIAVDEERARELRKAGA